MKKFKHVSIAVFLVLAVFAAGCFGGGGDDSERYARGVITESGFESEFLNLRFALPAGFHMLSEEEIQDMVEFAEEVILDNDGRPDILQALTVYEMMAMAPIGAPNVSVIVERLILRTSLENYIESFKAEILSELGDAVEISDENVNVEFAGETYRVVTATLHMFGMEMHQMYLFRQIDNRVVSIIATYTDDTAEEKQAMMDAFSPF